MWASHLNGTSSILVGLWIQRHPLPKQFHQQGEFLNFFFSSCSKILIKWRFCNHIFFPGSAVLRVVPSSCCTLAEEWREHTIRQRAQKNWDIGGRRIYCGKCVRLVSLFGEYLLVFEFLCWPLLLTKQTIYDCQGFPSGWAPENKKCFIQIITFLNGSKTTKSETKLMVDAD